MIKLFNDYSKTNLLVRIKSKMENTNIYYKYTELYNWWFNPVNKRCWFDSTDSDDLEISNKFGDLLEPDFIEFTQENIEKLDFTQSIGYILVHDQVVRH